MKTGANQDVKNFINLNSLQGQKFFYEPDYYNLHNHDIDSYDRKIAIVDVRHDNNKFKHSASFNHDFQKRCEILHSQGFVFIQNTAWESIDNIKKMDLYPFIPVQHMIWAGGVSWFWAYMFNKHKNSNFIFDHSYKRYDFLYLNKQKRDHRSKLYDKLIEKGILENSLYTNWPERKLPYEYELPWAKNYPSWGLDQDLYEKPYNETNCNIVSETNDNDYDVFMTEKIWKPIIAKQIFIVHGNYLYLQKLKELGFRTFHGYFDEGYDIERDADKRIDKIVDLCTDLRSRNWRDLYLQTKNHREHNFNTFFDREKLSVEVNKTLKLFFEFADSR